MSQILGRSTNPEVQALGVSSADPTGGSYRWSAGSRGAYPDNHDHPIIESGLSPYSPSHSSRSFNDHLPGYQNYNGQYYDPAPPPATPPYAARSLEFDEPKPWYRRFPWLIVFIVSACIIVFIVTMGVNNCPGHVHRSGQTCVIRVLGRFSFEPLKVNPMFGPTALILKDMGALVSDLVVRGGQAWRLFTCMWLHVGVIHIAANMLAVVFLGLRLEKEFGALRVAAIYLLSGLCGATLSCLFLLNEVSVGASGALFGLIGATVAELLMNWSLYDNRLCALFNLFLLIAVNLALGLMPMVDNFAHIGGLIGGFLLGLVLLPKPQAGWVDLRRATSPSSSLYSSSQKFSGCQSVTRIVAGALFVIGFGTALAVLFSGVNANKECTWCHYLSCVPTSYWTCDVNGGLTKGTGNPVCQVITYTNGTGSLRCSNQTMSSFPNLGSYSDYNLRILCTQTCG